MTTIRQFSCDDFFKYNPVELSDQPRSLVFNSLNVYLKHLLDAPEYCLVAESPTGHMMGYILADIEYKGSEFAVESHSYISLLVTSQNYRNIGVASYLMTAFESISKQKRFCYIDLHVQVSNIVAIALYHKLNFGVYQTLNDYYWSELDQRAYLMRKYLL